MCYDSAYMGGLSLTLNLTFCLHNTGTLAIFMKIDANKVLLIKWQLLELILVSSLGKLISAFFVHCLCIIIPLVSISQISSL